ncbi:Integral membrane protein [Hypsibius exemplaris]|uniref:Integral membrane protein n=1 Tax=Hypsibius exemplaris TaxID=2072580 RepID=A0A1W0WLN7_HYPEX|nr:Integral membrane protein [Hypsibius exemplaris]
MEQTTRSSAEVEEVDFTNPITQAPPFFPTVGPGFTPAVRMDLTIVFIVLYSLQFVFSYVQLWLILYYRHKRLSHQSVFLFLCLIWSGLRTTLFSFYFKNARLANDLPIFAYWLLYCFPVCIQFGLLCLLVLYFAQVLIKARVRYGGPRRYTIYLRLGMSSVVLLFLATDITCAVINKMHQNMTLLNVVWTRVIVCDTLFILAGCGLSFCVYKLATMSSANILLEAKGATVCQATAVCIATIFIYCSRAIYDYIAIGMPTIPGFNYGWINVSDEADLFNVHLGYGYLSFGLVLFFWEFLPTFIVVLFFRVRRPDTIATTSTINSTHSIGSYFFNTSRRPSSTIQDEEISRSTGAIPSPRLLEDPRLTRSLTGTSAGSPRRQFMYRRMSDRPVHGLLEDDEYIPPPPEQPVERVRSVSTNEAPSRLLPDRVSESD